MFAPLWPANPGSGPLPPTPSGFNREAADDQQTIHAAGFAPFTDAQAVTLYQWRSGYGRYAMGRLDAGELPNTNYDLSHTFFQLYRLSGNSSFLVYAIRAANLYYDQMHNDPTYYAEGHGGGVVAETFNYTDGLTDLVLSGNDVSGKFRAMVREIALNSSPSRTWTPWQDTTPWTKPGDDYPTTDYHRARATAWALGARMNLMRIMADPRFAAEYTDAERAANAARARQLVGFAKGYLIQWFGDPTANPPVSPSAANVKVFMAGLTIERLVEWNQVSGDPTVLPYVRRAGDALMSAPYFDDDPWLYHYEVGMPDLDESEPDPLDLKTDLNMIWAAPNYAWAFDRWGAVAYDAQASRSFRGGLQAYLGTASAQKHFGLAYHNAAAYLGLRNEVRLHGDALELTGGPGTDEFEVRFVDTDVSGVMRHLVEVFDQPAAAARTPLFSVDRALVHRLTFVDSGGGGDRLRLVGADRAEVVTVYADRVTVDDASGGGDPTLTVSVGADVQLAVDGAGPAAAPGDRLEAAPGGSIDTAGGGSGSVTFVGGGKAVTFSGFESVGPGHADPNAPRVAAVRFDPFARTSQFFVTFTADVSASLATASGGLGGRFPDLTIVHLGTGLDRPAPQYDWWDAATLTATFTLPGEPGGLLPDGNFRLTLPRSSVADSAGRHLAADATLDFFVLTGDANRDRVVNFDDLLILAKNYNTPGKTFADGDFNRDGLVNFDDLLILAKHYNAALPAPAPAFVEIPNASAAPAAATALLADDATRKPVFSTGPVVGKPAPKTSPALRRPAAKSKGR